MKILWAALLAFACALALHAQESGISPNPPDPAHPLPHDSIVRVTWSEADQAGGVEIDHQKFAKPEDILEAVKAKLVADPELRIVFCPIGEVPFEFGKKVLIILRQAGVTRIAVAMPEKSMTLPPTRDALATPAPGSQLVIRVVWSAADNAGGIEIEGRKFAKADEILPTLQAWAKEKPAARVLIRADRTVHYDYLKQVVIVAGKAGVGKVTFSVVDDTPPVPVQ